MMIGTQAIFVRDEYSNHSLIPASGYYAPVASKRFSKHDSGNQNSYA